MDILICGALPPPLIAQELIKELPKDSFFARLLARHRAIRHQLQPEAIGCSPAEYYRVQQHQFVPQGGQRYADAVPLLDSPAAFKAELSEDDGLYALALCHLHFDLQSSRLIPHTTLQLDKEQSLALFEPIKYLFAEKRIHLVAIEAGFWLLRLPRTVANSSIDTPAHMAYKQVHDYWVNAHQSPELRRLSNEVQMLWHDHPINQERKAQGQRIINCAWIFGGAHPQQLQAEPHYPYRLIEHLEPYYVNEDWAGWLTALEAVEADLDAMMQDKSRQSTPQRLLLAGYDQLLQLEPLNPWQRMFQAATHRGAHWHKWWQQESIDLS